MQRRTDPLEALDPRPSSPGTAELERLDRLNATTERELLEGYGRCSRCGGLGVVRFDLEANRTRMVECVRCDGTGRAPHP